MDLNELLKNNKISKYKLSKQSGVPYSTISDICTGKSKLEKCSAETLVRICHVLNMKVEDLFDYIVYPEIEVKEKAPKKKGKLKEIKASNKKLYTDEELEKIFSSAEFKPFRKKITVRILEMGELAFLVDNIKNKEVEELYNNNQIVESKFLLRILDDFCNQYNFPMLKEYDYIRNK